MPLSDDSFSLGSDDGESDGSNSMSSYEIYAEDDTHDQPKHHSESDSADGYASTDEGFHQPKRKQSSSNSPPRRQILKLGAGSKRSGGKQRYTRETGWEKTRSWGQFGSKADPVTLPSNVTQAELGKLLRPGAAHARSRPRKIQHPGSNNLRAENRSHAAKAAYRISKAPAAGTMLKRLNSQLKKVKAGFMYAPKNLKRNATAQCGTRRIRPPDKIMVQSSELTVRMEDGEPKMHCGACGLYLTRAATRDICGVGEHLTGPPHLAAMERKRAKNAKTVRLHRQLASMPEEESASVGLEPATLAKRITAITTLAAAGIAPSKVECTASGPLRSLIEGDGISTGGPNGLRTQIPAARTQTIEEVKEALSQRICEYLRSKQQEHPKSQTNIGASGVNTLLTWSCSPADRARALNRACRRCRRPEPRGAGEDDSACKYPAFIKSRCHSGDAMLCSYYFYFYFYF